MQLSQLHFFEAIIQYKNMINGCNHDHYICILFYSTQNGELQMILCCFTSQSFLQWDILCHFSRNTPFWIQKSTTTRLYSSITTNTMLYCTQNDELEMILCCFTTQSFLQWDILCHFSTNTPFWIQKSITISLYSSITIITMLYCTQNGQL